MLMRERDVKSLMVSICTNFKARGITIQDAVPDYLADVPQRYFNDKGFIDIDTDQLGNAVAGLLASASRTTPFIDVEGVQKALAEHYQYHYLWLGEKS